LLRVSSQQPGPFNPGEDKGINCPDSALDLPALSERDHADLRVAAAKGSPTVGVMISA